LANTLKKGQNWPLKGEMKFLSAVVGTPRQPHHWPIVTMAKIGATTLFRFSTIPESVRTSKGGVANHTA